MLGSSILMLNDSNYARIIERHNYINSLRAEKKSYYLKLDNNEELKNKLMKQRIFMVFEGEEFYIRLLRLPRVRRYMMNDIIRNELTYIFKDINHFNFAYEVFSKDKRETKVLVVCINSEKNSTFKALSSKCNIKGVYLIQLYFFQHIKSLVRTNKNIIIFQYNNYIYILANLGGKIIANAVIKDYGKNPYEILDKVNHVVSRANEIEKELKILEEDYEIVAINIRNKTIIEFLRETLNCYDFGILDVEEIVNRLR